MKKVFFLFILIMVLITGLFPEENRGVQVLVKDLNENYKIGKQYLVLIGINKYQYWPPLQNPVKDAQKIKKTLTENYYIDEVFELLDKDATKANIIKLFEDLQKKLEINDSLLVFYAGHGHLDNTTNSGFWIPVNAGLDKYEQSNWLPNTQIRGIISNIKAIHLLVISDSCFSGDLLDSSRAMPDEINNEYFKKAYGRISRQILTSGASETVPDASEFCKMLEMSLAKNASPYLDPLMLFNDIRLGVSKTSPLIGNLKNTGHQEGASFLLFLKREETDMTIGSLIIKTSAKDMEVYLDADLLGPLDSGVFEDIPVGTYTVVLQGEWEYWESEITITGNKKTTVKAVPRGFGMLTYDIKEGAAAEIKGKSYSETLEGKGTISRLWAGDYTITVKGENFKDYKEKVSMKKGVSYTFEPELEYTKEYSAYLKKVEEDILYKEYSARLDKLAELFEKGVRIGQEDINTIAGLIKEIEDAEYTYTDLINKGESFYAKAQERKTLWEKLDSSILRRDEIVQEIKILNKKQVNPKWITIGAGAASLLISGISLAAGNSAYEKYEQATTYDDILDYKSSVKTWDTLFLSGLCGSAVSAGVTTYLYLRKPKAKESDNPQSIRLAELNRELTGVNKEIEELEDELK